MSNITMSIDDELLKKARKIAIDKTTSLTGLIRNYLIELVAKEELNKRITIMELKKVFSKGKAIIGSKKWSREELHERN